MVNYHYQHYIYNPIFLSVKSLGQTPLNAAAKSFDQEANVARTPNQLLPIKKANNYFDVFNRPLPK